MGTEHINEAWEVGISDHHQVATLNHCSVIMRESRELDLLVPANSVILCYSMYIIIILYNSIFLYVTL